jgi:hypothetical protein
MLIQDIFHIPTTTEIRNGEVCDGKWLVLFFVVHARVHYRKIGIKIRDISVIGWKNMKLVSNTWPIWTHGMNWERGWSYIKRQIKSYNINLKGGRTQQVLLRIVAIVNFLVGLILVVEGPMNNFTTTLMVIS